MKQSVAVLAIVMLAVFAAGEVRFSETFDGDWESKWINSEARSDFGKFELSAGEKFVADENDKGLQTSQDARFYALGTTFPEFSNEGKPLVVALTVKHEQQIDCGGGYVKLLGGDANLKDFTGDSPYNIMFGPDICGPPTKKIHFIFSYKGENLLWKKTPRAETDTLTHLYTAIVYPDNTYTVEVDNKEIESGNLVDDWEFLEPEEIPDPDAKKPADWVDDEMIDDPEDSKPEDWDNEPEFIADPEAERPEDWDDELDGEWEAPMIENPEFKGEWKPRKIPNPEYQGPWEHPMILNPNYVKDDELYLYKSIGGIAIDIWQVKSGTIFDHIFVGDDIESYREWAKFFDDFSEKEQAAFDKFEEERKAKEEEERKAREEAARQAEEEEEEEEEEEDEEDEEEAEEEGGDSEAEPKDEL